MSQILILIHSKFVDVGSKHLDDVVDTSQYGRRFLSSKTARDIYWPSLQDVTVSKEPPNNGELWVGQAGSKLSKEDPCKEVGSSPLPYCFYSA